MNKYICSALLICVCCLFGNNNLNAQNLSTEEVDVIKNFDARLADSERFRLNPQLPPPDSSLEKLNYSVLSHILNMDYPAPRIKPLAFRTDDLGKVYNGYLKAGAGYPLSLLLDGAYHAVPNENSELGFFLKHHSTNNDNNFSNQRFSYSKADLTGRVFLDQGLAIGGKLGYTLDEVAFYGYNALNETRDSSNLLVFDRESVRQRFSVFDVETSVSNGEQTIGDLSYEAKIGAYFMQDYFASRENGLKLDLNAKKWFNETDPLALSLVIDLSNFKDTATQKLNNFYLRPSYTLHKEGFRVKVGANIASSNDLFFFYPDIEVSAGIAGSLLHVFAGAEGNLEKNNFRNLTDYNPFLISDPILRNTDYYHFFGGVKGTLEGINYLARVGYKKAKDLALFQATPDSIPKFEVLYDNVNIFSLHASLSGEVANNLSLTGTLDQHIYTPENQEKAWLLPAFTLQIGARYLMLDEKLAIKASLFTENGIPYLNSEGVTERLNALFDLSLGADYTFAENLGGFVKLNNLANNKRQRWTNYPVLGWNVLAGLSARF